MTWTNIKRVARTGFVNFWRNATISLASVMVMSVSLFVLMSLLLSSAAGDSVMSLLKDKVDVNIYFKTNVSELEILDLKDKLSVLPEVKEVTYTSKEDALASFKERHKDNTLILNSLEELKDNPLGAIISIKTKEPSQYEGVAKFLEGDVALSADGSSIIDNNNFYQNKMAIDRLTKLIESSEKIGFYIFIVFILMAIVVTQNTIRLAIYNSKEEISVMRLMGANNWYIRGPFVVSGIMSGLLASFLTLVIFYPITLWMGGKTESFLAGINIFAFYKMNFFQIAGKVFISGMILGGFSSYLSVRRYLHV